MNQAPPEFDRQMALSGMLGGVPKRALDAAMERSVGPAWQIKDVDGATLRAGATPIEGESLSTPLVVDLDKVGTLTVPAARQPWLDSAARWIELLLGAANRYRMAADLHLQAVHADHRELMAKHAALAESEQRYRTLSAELEDRVLRQVALIEQSQRRMYETEKMASIGNLAAGMAHEINNPMGFVRSNLTTAKSYVASLTQAIGSQQWDPPRRADLDDLLEDFQALLAESLAGADRVARIVADLKAYASSGAMLREQADLNQTVHAAMRMMGELPAGVHIELDLQPLPPYLCDTGGLSRLMLALLTNAIAAMRRRTGTIRISTAVSDAQLLIRVADQGCGIEARVLPQIFDPFFTTHDVGGGVGLGLTVASDVARAHGGHIAVDSTPGKGSIFTVSLPLVSGAAA